MKILEHKSKHLLQNYGIAVPSGKVVTSSEEAGEIAATFLRSAAAVVLKAQVLSGGRGKGVVIKEGKETGGGVRFVRSAAQAQKEAAAMLGGKLVTAQNHSGLRIDSILIEEGVEFDRQIYLSIVVDRSGRSLTFIFSPEGGTEIEQIAAENPQKIFKMNVDLGIGWMPYHGRLLSSRLAVAKEAQKAILAIGKGMVDLLVQKDCSLVEINPLVLTRQGNFIALDAKIVIDDNSLSRHPDLIEAMAPIPEELIEFEAKKAGLSYIKLDGNIGCLVNGAGLAMATMDSIKFYGGEPANFLDVGGTASEEAVKKAFTIILSDPTVKAIFVNIFGGIMRCDVIARGIVGATKELDLKTPLIVRLEGNMVEEGRKILAESGLRITPVSGMGEGAQKAVEAAKAS